LVVDEEQALRLFEEEAPPEAPPLCLRFNSLPAAAQVQADEDEYPVQGVQARLRAVRNRLDDGLFSRYAAAGHEYAPAENNPSQQQAAGDNPAEEVYNDYVRHVFDAPDFRSPERDAGEGSDSLAEAADEAHVRVLHGASRSRSPLPRATRRDPNPGRTAAWQAFESEVNPAGANLNTQQFALNRIADLRVRLSSLRDSWPADKSIQSARTRTVSRVKEELPLLQEIEVLTKHLPIPKLLPSEAAQRQVISDFTQGAEKQPDEEEGPPTPEPGTQADFPGG